MKEEKSPKDEKRAALKRLFDTMSIGDADSEEKACRSYMEEALFSKEMISEYCGGNPENNIDELYDMLVSLQAKILLKWLVKAGIYPACAGDEKALPGRNYIIKAREYIRQNYADKDLSLDSVCEMLKVSNSYFSTIFKRDTGESFVEYLTDYRMNKARDLLATTNEKSYIIAEKVGYSDPNYFSYVFKKEFGVSPTKFRERYSIDSPLIAAQYSQNQE